MSKYSIYLTNYLADKSKKNKDALIMSSTHFIYKVLDKYKWHNDYNELVQQAYIGVIKAADTFDVAKAKEFSTHAYYCIMHEISSYLVNQLPLCVRRNHKIAFVIHKCPVHSHNELQKFADSISIDIKNLMVALDIKNIEEFEETHMGVRRDNKPEKSVYCKQILNKLRDNPYGEEIIKNALLGRTSEELSRDLGVSAKTLRKTINTVREQCHVEFN